MLPGQRTERHPLRSFAMSNCWLTMRSNIKARWTLTTALQHAWPTLTALHLAGTNLVTLAVSVITLACIAIGACGPTIRSQFLETLHGTLGSQMFTLAVWSYRTSPPLSTRHPTLHALTCQHRHRTAMLSGLPADHYPTMRFCVKVSCPVTRLSTSSIKAASMIVPQHV